MKELFDRIAEGGDAGQQAGGEEGAGELQHVVDELGIAEVELLFGVIPMRGMGRGEINDAVGEFDHLGFA